MAWVVVPALNNLLKELNAVAPYRDKASDGSIGDTSHSAGASDHNPDETGHPESYDADNVDEVRARDFDKDLNQPGLTMEMVCQHLVNNSRSGNIKWIKYIIFNKRIWSASQDWKERAYSGKNTHEHHMHVSCKPDTVSENDVKPLGLATLITKIKEIPVAGSLVELHKGMQDPISGYNYVWRAQLLLKIDADGIYGPNMTKAVAKYNAEVLSRKTDGTTIDAVMWRRLYGIKS